jgi:hypothetical protein
MEGRPIGVGAGVAEGAGAPDGSAGLSAGSFTGSVALAGAGADSSSSLEAPVRLNAVGRATAVWRSRTHPYPRPVSCTPCLSVVRVVTISPPITATMAITKTGNVPIALASVFCRMYPMKPPPQPHVATLRLLRRTHCCTQPCATSSASVLAGGQATAFCQTNSGV